jgi:hypothetical protein
MKPLPVQVNRCDNPDAQRPRQQKSRPEHDNWQDKYKEPVFPQALSVKRKSGKGRYNMVITEQEEVSKQDRAKQVGPPDHDCA